MTFETQLETTSTPFIGRNKQLSTLSDFISNGERLVSIVGPPGVGKTRLANEFGRHLSEEGRDVYLGRFRTTRTSRQLVVQLGELFNLQFQKLASVAEAREQLTDWLQQKAFVVILDNVEQVRQPASDLLRQLTEETDKPQFISTSRQPLNSPGERVFSLPPLDTEEGKQLYRASTPSDIRHELDDEQLERLVDNLEGTALSIELAGSRYPVLSPDELNSRLEQQLDVLQESSKSGQWKSTLRNSIERSWSLLSDFQKEVLGRVSFFEAPWTVEATSALFPDASNKQVREAISELLDKSLLRRFSNEKQDGSGSKVTRHRLYEAVRQFGREKISGNTDLSEYYIEYWRQRVSSLVEQLESAESSTARQLLLDEQPDIIKAFEYAESHAPFSAATIAEQLAIARRYLTLFIEPSELLACGIEAVNGDTSEETQRLRVRLRTRRQIMTWTNQSHDKAKQRFSQLESKANSIGELKSRVFCIQYQAIIDRQRGNYADALERLESGLESLPAAATPRHRSQLKSVAAGTHKRLGNLRKSFELYRDVLEVMESVRTPADEAVALACLADIMNSISNGGRARQYLNRATHIAGLGDDNVNFKYVHQINRAESHLVEREYDTALKWLQAAREPCSHLRGNWHRSLIELEIGLVLLSKQNYPEAKKSLHGSLEQTNVPRTKGRAYGWLGIIGFKRESYERGLELANEATQFLPDASGFSKIITIWKKTVETILDSEPTTDTIEAHRTEVQPYQNPKLDTDISSSIHSVMASQFFDEWSNRLLLDIKSPDVIAIESSEASWFSIDGDSRVQISGRGSAKRILHALVTARQASDKPERLDKFDLFEAGWPDEQQVDIETLSSRVYNALKELRNRGLDGTILTDSEGYYLNPEVDIKLES